MAKFMFAYHGGGMPETKEAQAAAMAAWGAFMEKHAAAFADGGNPVGMSKTVGADGIKDNGGSNPVSGYAFVTADTIEAACEIASECPIIADGGSVEVAPVMEM